MPFDEAKQNILFKQRAMNSFEISFEIVYFYANHETETKTSLNLAFLSKTKYNFLMALIGTFLHLLQNADSRLLWSYSCRVTRHINVLSDKGDP